MYLKFFIKQTVDHENNLNENMFFENQFPPQKYDICI